MRCDEFVDLVYDLARDGLIDVAGSEGLSHVTGCNSCAARLAAERHLNEALGISARADTESAPDSVRQALLQAFDNSRTPPPEAPVSSARPKWFAAAAAAALLAIALVISLRVTGRRSARHAPTPPPAAETPLQAGTQQEAATPGPPAPRYRKASSTSRRWHSLAGQDRTARDSLSAGALGPASADSYALTDFIPLTHLSSSTAIASGQIVRVKVPLSAFLPLGLPVSPDHADELVNAELVVGDDGVQRAIRLVR